MPAELKVVHMGRRAGKTTEALRYLHENGGGVFITRHGLEALRICRHHGFDGISIIPIEQGTNIAVDDVDFATGKVIVASTYPVTLDYIKTSKESGK